MRPPLPSPPPTPLSTLTPCFPPLPTLAAPRPVLQWTRRTRGGSTAPASLTRRWSRSTCSQVGTGEYPTQPRASLLPAPLLAQLEQPCGWHSNRVPGLPPAHECPPCTSPPCHLAAGEDTICCLCGPPPMIKFACLPVSPPRSAAHVHAAAQRLVERCCTSCPERLAYACPPTSRFFPATSCTVPQNLEALGYKPEQCIQF